MSCLSTIFVSAVFVDASTDADDDSNMTCCNLDNATIDFITSFGL